MGRGRTFFGVLLSAIYLIWVSLLVLPKLDCLPGMALNEIGDFFAGIFGPLAFLWLVLGYFQQGAELRQNNEALRLQAEELRNSVNQQKEMVNIAGRQLAAELDNVQYSREKFEESTKPNFVLSAVVPEATMDKMKVRLRIDNLGGPVEEFKVIINGNWVAHESTALATGQTKFADIGLGLQDCAYEVKICSKYAGGKDHWVGFKMTTKALKDNSGIAKVDFMKAPEV